MDKVLASTISEPTPGKQRYLRAESDYEEKETGETRVRKFFAILPVYLGQPDLIPLPGCKFTWLKRVEIVQKRVMHRVAEFDDGWSYQTFWKEWKDKWVTIKITRL